MCPERVHKHKKENYILLMTFVSMCPFLPYKSICLLYQWDPMIEIIYSVKMSSPPPPNSDSVFTAVVRLPAYTPQFHHS